MMTLTNTPKPQPFVGSYPMPAAPLHLGEVTVQFSCSVMSDSLGPHKLQHASLPVHHPLPEFTQTHVHRVGDAIQLSHPLSSPSPPAPNPSQHQITHSSKINMSQSEVGSFSLLSICQWFAISPREKKKKSMIITIILQGRGPNDPASITMLHLITWSFLMIHFAQPKLSSMIFLQ